MDQDKESLREDSSHQDDPILPRRNCVRQELQTSFFSLKEPNGKVIDVKATFAPEPVWIIAFIRAAFLVFMVFTMVLDIVGHGEKWIWIGYLTRWALLYTILYQILILFCSVKQTVLTQPNTDERPNNLICFIWVLYSTAVSHELSIIFLYWGTVHVPGSPVQFVSVVTHGIAAALLLIDGAFIAKIPVRLKHLIVMELVAIIYLIWSVIHSLTGIGIRKENNVGAPLYNSLDWKGNPNVATIVTLVTLLVLTPSNFMFAWVLSFYSPPFSFNRNNRRVIDPQS